MVNTADNNVFLMEHVPELKGILSNHVEVFRTSFSSALPVYIEPLKMDSVKDATPVCVRLLNYLQTQRDFLADTVSKLVESSMVYPSPTSSWACATLLVAKPGSDK